MFTLNLVKMFFYFLNESIAADEVIGWVVSAEQWFVSVQAACEACSSRSVTVTSAAWSETWSELGGRW